MWSQVKRETQIKQSGNEMFVTARNKRVLHFNKSIVRYFNIENGFFVDVFFNKDDSKMKIVFSKTQSDNSFSLSNDGGCKDKKSSSLIIQCLSVYKNSKRLSAIASSKEKNDKRLQISKIEDNSIEIDLIPFFEHNLKTTKLSNETTGIYCLLKNKEVVYIGKGLIQNRVNEHKKNGLTFDDFCFSIIDDDKKCLYFESLHIDSHIKNYGTLPLYNKIKGHNFG